MKWYCCVALAAMAMSSPLSSVQNYVRDLERRDSTSPVSQEDYELIKFYAQHASAAYCNSDKKPGDRLSCKGKGTCPALEVDPIVVVATFSGKWTGVGGYVTRDIKRKEIVLALRGSSSIRNFITDILFGWTHCDFGDGCKIHTGFSKSWGEIADAASRALNDTKAKYPDYKVIVTGHSLGGAVATIATANFRKDGHVVDIFTYGTPRVGNDHFAKFVTEQKGDQWRVTHGEDPVPRLPPLLFGYRHISPEYWLAHGKSDQVEYKPSDFVKCDGIANAQCNGGTFGLDIIAHLHYMGDTAGCAPFPLNWKRSVRNDTLLDDALEHRLNEWSRKDQELAATLTGLA